MADMWFYGDGTERKGPVDLATLGRLRDAGTLASATPVWREGRQTSMPLGEVLDLLAGAPAAAPPPQRGLLGSLGGKLSEMAGVPEIGDVPVGHVLTGGLSVAGANEDIFAVGTAATTPPLSEVPAGWPRPRVWWRILLGAILTYLLLRVGITEFHNPNFLPGLIVIGSFVVPMSVVVFFFEMNTPANVSIYQVGKMMLLGGAAGLLITMLL
ncbi:MAG TPA: DUF4339 domain-containing protein, partial [Planctomycetota bacterium]|nr:DUF4339 domain-containing protein [Planctomycetota bacterium]